MTWFGHTDYYTEVRRGNVPGEEIIHKFGRNAAVGNSFEGVHTLSGAFNFLTAATTVRIKAGGNVNDTAAGTGAQGITVEGIDDNLAAISENLATAGASASSNSSALLWRVNRIFVEDLKAGTYGGKNVGAVVVENSGGGTDLIEIVADFGQSLQGLYSVPTGKTAFFLGAILTTDANKAVDFRVCSREALNDVSTPFAPVRVRNSWTGIEGHFPFQPKSPAFSVVGPADIFVEAQIAAGSADVTADFELLLVDD